MYQKHLIFNMIPKYALKKLVGKKNNIRVIDNCYVFKRPNYVTISTGDLTRVMCFAWCNSCHGIGVFFYLNWF